MKVLHKTHFSAPLRLHGKMSFAVSAESVDRYGDIIIQSGIDYRRYLLNSVALFNHDSAQPVGTFGNLRIENGKLHADLEFLPKGLSPRVDEIRALCEHGVIKGTSIGFLPVASEPILTNGRQTGTRFTKSELVEISVCPIPAQSEALAVARSLNISRATMARVFDGGGSLVSEHIAKARKAVAAEHKYSEDVANIERRIARLWTRIKNAATTTEQVALYKQIQLQEKLAIALTPEHLQTADQKQQKRADAIAAEKVKNDPWGVEAAHEGYIRRMTERTQRMEREAIARQKAEGTYIDPNPSPSTGNTVTWRGVKIDLTPVWRGRKIF